MKLFESTLLVLLLVSLGESSSVPSPEDGLREKLLDGYNKHSLPASNNTIKIGFTLVSLGVDAEVQSLDLLLWPILMWKEPRFSWSNEEYEMKQIAFEPSTIWTPELALYNDAAGLNLDAASATTAKVIVYQNGETIWVPPLQLSAKCQMDMEFWPYDEQECNVKFGPWVYSVDNIDYEVTKSEIDFIDNDANSVSAEWEIVTSQLIRESTTYPCCPEQYVDVKIELGLRRISDTYTWLVILPVAVLSLMVLVVFVLPADSSQKISLGSVLFLAQIFVLFSVNRLIGSSATNNTPLIMKFISTQVVLCGMSVFVSALTILWARQPHSSGLPSWLKTIAFFFSSLLCLNSYKKRVEEKPYCEKKLLESKEEILPSDEWLLLAAVTNRICLIVYVIVLVFKFFTFACAF